MNSARAVEASGNVRGGDGRSAGGRGRRRTAARHALLAAAVGSVLLLATACGSGSTPTAAAAGGGSATAGSTSGGGSGDAATTAPANSAAVVTIKPENDATDVDTTGALKVGVASGKLTSVKVTSSDGAEVAGAIAADGSSWTPSGALRSGTKYTVATTAVDSSQVTVSDKSTFTTLTPKNINIGNFNVDPGAVYGVGMEVSITFTHPVGDSYKKAVQQAVSVSASPSVPVVGHWFGDSRIDFRPQSYWAAGTKVTLHMDLDGVRTSSGTYGQQFKDVKFSIGRSQTSVADSSSHTLKVYRGGVLYRTLPASLGDAQHTTYNGKMVISEKDPVVDMDSQTVGLGNAYRIKDVPHAMRLTTSGTFAHGNYWRPVSTFGSENTSHGCVGLHDVKGGGDPNTPAAWFYNSSIIGDVVQVVNSHDKIVAPDNGLNGWNMSWAAWTAS
ncbi:L,D-transpeptidase [Streptacidiphilus cavernicola]|uniref:Ig-like domain-containing protein n=1 Tax=Streptacidiphilus cavernicola TaxID=3342716 RepID=A0ABV6W2K2_9ACTN